jgi:hypothetical protein
MTNTIDDIKTLVKRIEIKGNLDNLEDGLNSVLKTVIKKIGEINKEKIRLIKRGRE